MKLFIFRIILFILCSIVIGYFLSKIIGYSPIVYWSVSKDECIKVVVFDRNKKDWIEKDCTDIPKKYERIWVE